jgi:processive 1,2-diacylglycerol beta-glucosyltransferase
MSKILVLTASFGEGHNAAARALVSAIDREAGPGTAVMADIFALAAPRYNELVRRTYLNLINRAPGLWIHFYRWSDRSSLVTGSFGPRFFIRELRVLREILAREKPDAVCCTFPVATLLLEHLARTGGPVIPRYNVVTDSISIHSIWCHGTCDGWFVPNEDSAAVVLQAGLNPARVHVSGFPVPAIFSEQAGVLAPPDLATGAAPRVLHIINSGTRHAEATARRLIAEDDWEITCAVGRNEKLRSSLEALAAGRRRPATILGWTKEVPRLLMTHHIVVSKAGGATTQEAINALCPMIVSQVVPGQEEGNYELLRRHRAGRLAESPDAVIAALREAFADQGRVLGEWRAALATLAHPTAARDIAQHVLAASEPVAAASRA